MILISATLLAIIIALLFAPSIVCSKKADAAVATSAKKVEKDEEPEPEPEETDNDSDDEPAAD